MNKHISKIWLLSSATGGHAIPVLEVYKRLEKQKTVQPLIIHSGSIIEKEIFKGTSNLISRSGKFNRHQIERNIPELFRFTSAFIRAFLMLIFYRPNLIFSKGGFNAAPFLYWARVLKIPYFLHESDSEMGAANKYFYRNSIKTFVSFPIEQYHIDESKLAYSGFIVREFAQPENKNSIPIILITGGSQGARAINEAIFQLLPQLVEHYQIIHHIGLNDEQKAVEFSKSLKDDLQGRYHYFVFSTEEMIDAMVRSDLIISRAGSTIAEIAALSKASILIPYPYAASNHQAKNARYLQKHGAAIVIKQEQLTDQALFDRIKFILGDRRNAEIIGKNINKCLKTDGAKMICDELLRYMKEK